MISLDSQLPKGWASATVDDIANVKGRVGWKGYKKTDLRKSGPLVIGATHLSKKWQIDINEPVYISEEKYDESPEIKVSLGDIILAQRGSIGKVALLNSNIGKATINPCVLLLKNISINNRYLLYVLASPSKQDYLINGNKSTTTPMITQEFVKGIQVPIAPLSEQERIVGKVEELFSFLDAGVASLRVVQSQLKRYRQSVLKAAFEGKLTEQWRLTNKEKLETSENIADRVKAAKVSTLGKKYKEPPKLSIESLPVIPSEWCWQNFSLVIKKVKRGPSLKCNQTAKGIRYVTSGNLQEGKIRLDLDYKFLDKFDDAEKCRLLPKDLIFNCVNSLEQIGKSAVFEKEHGDAIVGFNNYALELETSFIIPEFANMVCQSDFFKRQVYFLIKRAVNQVSFATRELDFMAIPLPSLIEQKVILNEIERYLSMISKTSSDLKSSLKLSNGIRQSVLKLAFEGKLVPQDPNDEPAERLLECIKANRLTNKPKNNQLELSKYVK